MGQAQHKPGQALGDYQFKRYSGFDTRCLTVYRSPFPKRRLGRDNDGGYVIAELPGQYDQYDPYDLLLSAGISDDISFEEAFCALHTNVPCVAHDGTIQKLPKEHPNITFVKKNIGPSNTNKTTTMQDLLRTHRNVFLKMDIEGAEFDWLNCLSLEELGKLSQIVMEFHWPKSEYHQQLFEKLNVTHYMIHFHGNNATREVAIHKGVVTPVVFECTYINKKYFNNVPEFNTDIFPTAIDQPNCPLSSELYINYPPFVHNH